MQNWTYNEVEPLEGLQNLCRNFLTEDTANSLSDGSSNRNPAEACTGPLYSQDSTLEDHTTACHYQDELKICVKTEDEDDEEEEEEEEEEEIFVRGDQPCKEEEIPVQISTVPRDTRGAQQDFKAEEDEIRHLNVIIKEEEFPTEISADGERPGDSPNNDGEAAEENGTASSSSDPNSTTPLTSFSCSECGKSFALKCFLYRHQAWHLRDDKPFSCSICGKCFKVESEFIFHERIHNEERPFSCSECGKCFLQKRSLVTHQRIHTGEKPYACSKCGKCFTQQGDFTKHQKIHTGEKPFSCSRCDKRFTERSTLVIHERVHTGEKPYSCSECGKCFAQKSNLNTHQHVHTGIKPYPCTECEKSFTQKHYLVKHEKEHIKEKQC